MFSVTKGDKNATSCSDAGTDEPQINPFTIICDTFYGFPNEKKPRKERILAVSRQLSNFICWYHQYAQSTKYTKNVEVVVLGKKEDVKPIEKRLNQIKNSDDDLKSALIDTDNNFAILFLPDVSLETLCSKSGLNSEISLSRDFNSDQEVAIQNERKENAGIVYLSPDASEVLCPSSEPPSVVVVGMLVDRRICRNRSKNRAESIRLQDTSCELSPQINRTCIAQLRCARLPLESMNVSDILIDEPLNIDTVMEMTVRWRNNWTETSDRGSKCFTTAASQAMLTHRGRHPNRIIHGH